MSMYLANNNMTRTKTQAEAQRGFLITFLLLLLEAFVVYQSIQNGDWFVVFAVSILSIQHLIGGWIYYDKTIRELETDIWYAAFVIPVIGILTLPVYLHSRNANYRE